MKALVQSAGFLSSIQDLGRPGYRQSGVSLGGALDRHALRVANAVVGNDDAAAGIEITLGRLRLRFEDDRMVAWCGGAFSARIGDVELAAGRCGFVANGDELIINAPETGGRAWLGISGGIDVPMALGSRSTDLRGNFGGYEGRALQDADVLSLNKERPFTIRREKRDSGLESVAPWGAPASWANISRDNVVLRIVPGADWQRFTGGAQRALANGAFTVCPDSDRMGVRLEGPELQRNDPGDLLSEAVAPGTLQVPPNGKPILLLGDCQTIGGYPKIGHVITVDLPIAAQLWPGDTVRFAEVSLADAHRLLREREEDFARFRIGLSLQTQ
jgi:antagonist of KipI